MILTDGTGRPFERPRREDFASNADFVRAYHAFKDEISECANRSFDAGLRAELGRQRTISERMAAQERSTERVLPWSDVEEVARP